MLYASTTDAQKRRTLRDALSSKEALRYPGAFNPLSAKLIQRKGFDGVYVSGAVLSADLGLPDIGLTTTTEVAQRVRQITRMTDLPALVDADTGFGEPINVARTVQELEDAGVAALHIEDQVNPKRCGHLDGKQVVDDAAAAKRIRAAVDARRDPDLVIVARTDIRAVHGLEATLDRARLLAHAGADVLFPEALHNLSEFEAVRKAVKIPVLANMTEFGKSELFTVDALRDTGVSIVIWPVSLLRGAMGAADRALDTLLEHGTLQSRLDEMQHRRELYDLVNYESYAAFDSTIFDFTLEEPNPGNDANADAPSRA